MERKATCACGQLSLQMTGDPNFVIACSCLKCQKRTGAVFGVSSYFDDEQIIGIYGDSNSFIKINDSGSKTTRQFCPDCGSTVYWKSEFFDKYTGVPVGAFADPEFPEPSFSVWNQSKHPWVAFPEQWTCSDTQEIELE